jgi:hypothetical protein
MSNAACVVPLMHHLYLPSSRRAKMNKNWKTQNNTAQNYGKSIVEKRVNRSGGPYSFSAPSI